MQVKIKLLSMAGPPPSGFDEFGERQLTCSTGATVADVIATLSLPKEEAYTTIINGASVPIESRATHKLGDGDEVTLFPAIQGG